MTADGETCIDTAESIVYDADEPGQECAYHKMKGDYHQCLAEFATGSERREAAENAMVAYQAASDCSIAELLPATDPLRLEIALNASVLLYNILDSPERASHLAKRAFDEAISELDTLKEDR